MTKEDCPFDTCDILYQTRIAGDEVFLVRSNIAAVTWLRDADSSWYCGLGELDLLRHLIDILCQIRTDLIAMQTEDTQSKALRAHALALLSGLSK